MSKLSFSIVKSVSRASITKSRSMVKPAISGKVATAVKDLEACVMQLDEGLAGRISGLMSFDDCEDMRGVSLSRVLGLCGKLFKNSGGSAATYLLSVPVTQIAAFISHNWVVPRTDKYIALIFHFNLVPAVVITFLFVGGITALSAVGLVPTLPDVVHAVHIGVPGMHSGFLCVLLAAPVFLTSLVFYRVLAAACGSQGPITFLDKVSIHQTDLEKQRKGIEKLGAYLLRSQRLLILFSDIYLEKLWTIYEVACFLSFREAVDISIVPTFQAKLFVFMIVLQWGVTLIIRALRIWAAAQVVVYACLVIESAVFYLYMRRVHYNRNVALKKLTEFDIHLAKCAVEADRPLVYANVVALMKAARVVTPGASEAEALAAFSAKVRKELSPAFRSMLGRVSFSYGQYVLVSFFTSGVMRADEVTDFDAGRPPRSVWCDNLQVAGALNLLIIPFAIAGFELASSFFLHLRGWRSAAWMVFSLLSLAVMCVGLDAVFRNLTVAAYTCDACLVALIVLIFLPPAAWYCIHNAWRKMEVVKRRSTKSATPALADRVAPPSVRNEQPPPFVLESQCLDAPDVVVSAHVRAQV